MYVSIRITPNKIHTNELEAINFIKNPFRSHFRTYFKTDLYGYVMEQYDKKGDKTDKHFHFNYFTDEKIVTKDAIQKEIRTWCGKMGYVVKGNKAYAVSLHGDPEDETRWWRYLLKEKSASPVFSKKLISHLEEDIEILKKMAQDERQLQVERNKKTLNRFMDKSSFRHKFYEYCDLNKVRQHKSFVKNYFSFCKEKGKVPAPSSLDGYWLEYAFEFEIITFDEWYSRKYPHGAF